MPTRRTAARTSATITVDDIEVLIARKRVRNVNLRVRRDGTVCVSAPSHVSEADIARSSHRGSRGSKRRRHGSPGSVRR